MAGATIVPFNALSADCLPVMVRVCLCWNSFAFAFTIPPYPPYTHPARPEHHHHHLFIESVPAACPVAFSFFLLLVVVYWTQWTRNIVHYCTRLEEKRSDGTRHGHQSTTSESTNTDRGSSSWCINRFLPTCTDRADWMLIVCSIYVDIIDSKPPPSFNYLYSLLHWQQFLNDEVAIINRSTIQRSLPSFSTRIIISLFKLFAVIWVRRRTSDRIQCVTRIIEKRNNNNNKHSRILSMWIIVSVVTCVEAVEWTRSIINTPVYSNFLILFNFNCCFIETLNGKTKCIILILNVFLFTDYKSIAKIIGNFR